MTKLTNYEKHFQKEIKNKAFRKAYEKEDQRLMIAYKIAQLRKKEKISQADLAKKLGTTQSVIARMEGGNQNFTADNLQKIAASFDRRLKVEFVK